jgi:putative endonuclease
VKLKDQSQQTKGRRQAWRRGRWAETLSITWLRMKGYHILAQDFRLGVGEIDIIAKRGQWLTFIEVKARSREATLELVSFRQRARIVRAAEVFVSHRPQLSSLKMRFDVILVEPGRWPKHVLDAWRPGD